MAEQKAEVVKAINIIQAAANTLQDRASTRDSPEGERSMSATVKAFNAIFGESMTETQGWLFMVLLKTVRSSQGTLQIDDYLDGTAYFALAGESAIKELLEQHEQLAQAAQTTPNQTEPLSPSDFVPSEL